jgi:8-oxo-dGTP diphosphatase
VIDFIGVKIALLVGNKLVAIQRDDKPGLRYAGLWDFPGGGREDDETPFACVAREVLEELELQLKKSDIIWQKIYPAIYDPSLTAYFMVAKLTASDVNAIKLGNEGQGWKLMSVEEFMKSEDAVEQLKGRLQDYLDSNLIPGSKAESS